MQRMYLMSAAAKNSLTAEATGFRELVLRKKHTHQNIPLGMQPKRKQIRESQLTAWTELQTEV